MPRCYKCGSNYIEKHADFLKPTNKGNCYKSKVIDFKYFECEKCGKRLYPKETLIEMEKQEK